MFKGILARRAIFALPLYALVVLPTAALGQVQPPWMTAWTGIGVSNSFLGTYVGGVWSPQRNVWADGLLFRADAAAGKYAYVPVGFGSLDVPTDSGDLLIGYRKSLGASSITGYVGVSYEAHHNPDPAAIVNGTRTGVRGLVEFSSPLGDALNFFALGSYATAFEHYFTMARLTYKVFDNLEIGPEVAALGSVGYRQWRVGPAVRIGTGFGEIVVSGGYVQNTLNVLTSEKEGFYASIYLGFLLR